jgi:hypothetical protein
MVNVLLFVRGISSLSEKIEACADVLRKSIVFREFCANICLRRFMFYL